MVEAADVVFSMLADELVARVVDVLSPNGIDVMVLKGALWQHTLYDRPGERTFADVDLLVAPGKFEAALKALVQAGFCPKDNPQGDHERELSFPGMRLNVDLHRSMFAHGRFRMGTRGLFERSSTNSQLFKRAVRVPAPLDQLAHLIGHHASEHVRAIEQRGQDLVRLITRERLDPAAAAAHLERHGLRRAAFFTLPELTTPVSQPFVGRCLGALARDPLGRACAALVRRVVNEGDPYGPVAIACAQSLNASFWQAGVSGFESTLRAVQRRLRGQKRYRPA